MGGDRVGLHRRGFFGGDMLPVMTPAEQLYGWLKAAVEEVRLLLDRIGA